MFLSIKQIFLVCAGLTVCAGNLMSQQSIVLSGATLIDGIRTLPIENSVVVIENGKITGVDRKHKVIIPPNARWIDLSGKYIIPGLIDAHVHYESRQGLVQMLAWGVTSANCMFESTDEALRLEKETASDTIHAPQIYAAAPIFTTHKGWWGTGFPTDSTIDRFPATPDSARAQVRKVKAKGIKRIKIMYDSMDWCRNPLEPFEQMKPEVMQALLDEAKRLDISTEIHAPKINDARDAIDAGARVFAHGIIDERLDAPFVAAVENGKTYFVPTFCLYEFLADVEGFMKHAMADERFRTALPHSTLEEYSNPDYYKKYRERYPNIDFVASHLKVLRSNTLVLRKNYVPVAMGTDMWALPGIAAHLELEYMVQAGFTPTEAIMAATTLTSQALAEGNRIGSLELGKQADLLILNSNPLADIKNTRDIYQIVKHGKFFDPKKLIEESKQ